MDSNVESISKISKNTFNTYKMSMDDLEDALNLNKHSRKERKLVMSKYNDKINSKAKFDSKKL